MCLILKRENKDPKKDTTKYAYPEEIKQDEKKKKQQNAPTYTYTMDSNGDPRNETYIILNCGEK